MPPRTAPARPFTVVEWSALLASSGSRRPKAARVPGQVQTKRTSRPASLSEALVRFVNRNWD